MTVTRLSVTEASAHILAGVRALGVERVSIDESSGRVAGADVISAIFLPPHDNASMDGFAVRSADVRGAAAGAPVTLKVIETIAAGALPVRTVQAGQASRIMTGAYVPAGADGVIRVEDTMSIEHEVTIRDDRDAGRNVRARGEDVSDGQCVVRAGTHIRAPHVGVLASVGCRAVEVYRKPRVAILSTGDELVPVEEFDRVRAGDRIVSSNSYALAAAVREAGGEPVALGISPDDPEQLAAYLQRAEGCDVVLTSGGVSVGDFDYTRRVVSALGGDLSLWRVRMRPGAPLGFGTLFGVPWLGLPGNPVSALVTFELFGRPLVRTLAGYARPHRGTLAVTLDEAISLAVPLTHFLRVTLDREGDALPRARLTGVQSSGMLTSMSLAEALLIVPPDVEQVPPGVRLRALLLDSDLGGSDRFLS